MSVFKPNSTSPDHDITGPNSPTTAWLFDADGNLYVASSQAEDHMTRFGTDGSSR